MTPNKQISVITCDWYNHGFCCGDSIVHEKTIVTLSAPYKVSVRRYNGRRQKLQDLTYFIPEETAVPVSTEINRLLNSSAWAAKYDVMVCDGYTWELRIRYSDAPQMKITGTVEPPPFWNSLSQNVRTLLENAHCADYPFLCTGFHCDDY